MQHSPHLAMERDCNGDLPLHIIAKDTFNRSSICQCIMCGDVQCFGPFQQNIEGNPAKESIIPENASHQTVREQPWGI